MNLSPRLKLMLSLAALLICVWPPQNRRTPLETINLLMTLTWINLEHTPNVSGKWRSERPYAPQRQTLELRSPSHARSSPIEPRDRRLLLALSVKYFQVDRGAPLLGPHRKSAAWHPNTSRIIKNVYPLMVSSNHSLLIARYNSFDKSLFSLPTLLGVKPFWCVWGHAVDDWI